MYLRRVSFCMFSISFISEIEWVIILRHLYSSLALKSTLYAEKKSILQVINTVVCPLWTYYSGSAWVRATRLFWLQQAADMHQTGNLKAHHTYSQNPCDHTHPYLSSLHLASFSMLSTSSISRCSCSWRQNRYLRTLLLPETQLCPVGKTERRGGGEEADTPPRQYKHEFWEYEYQWFRGNLLRPGFCQLTNQPANVWKTKRDLIHLPCNATSVCLTKIRH